MPSDPRRRGPAQSTCPPPTHGDPGRTANTPCWGEDPGRKAAGRGLNSLFPSQNTAEWEELVSRVQDIRRVWGLIGRMWEAHPLERSLCLNNLTFRPLGFQQKVAQSRPRILLENTVLAGAPAAIWKGLGCAESPSPASSVSPWSPCPCLPWVPKQLLCTASGD